MKRIFLVVLLMISVLGCGDGNVSSGGGGQSVASMTAPVLYNVFLTPQPTPPPNQIPVVVILDYADAGGDLNGGVVFFEVNGFSENRLLSGLSNSTVRTNAPGFLIFVQNPIVGNIPIRFFVKDRQGVQSNTITVFLSQPPFP